MKFVILLEIFIILGSWGVLFVFAKCNMKADSMALVSYADLVKKQKQKPLHILLASYASVKFFSKAFV